MPGSERLEFIFALIDGCKERGVTHFKADVDGHVEFVVSPLASLEDPLKGLVTERPKADPNKCSKCQGPPAEARYFGMCRACGMSEAGVGN